MTKCHFEREVARSALKPDKTKIKYRDVAQLGSALPWGGRGRRFKSCRSDHLLKRPKLIFSFGLIIFCFLSYFKNVIHTAQYAKITI